MPCHTLAVFIGSAHNHASRRQYCRNHDFFQSQVKVHPWRVWGQPCKASRACGVRGGHICGLALPASVRGPARGTPPCTACHPNLVLLENLCWAGVWAWQCPALEGVQPVLRTRRAVGGLRNVRARLCLAARVPKRSSHSGCRPAMDQAPQAPDGSHARQSRDAHQRLEVLNLLRHPKAERERNDDTRGHGGGEPCALPAGEMADPRVARHFEGATEPFCRSRRCAVAPLRAAARGRQPCRIARVRGSCLQQLAGRRQHRAEPRAPATDGDSNRRRSVIAPGESRGPQKLWCCRNRALRGGALPAPKLGP